MMLEPATSALVPRDPLSTLSAWAWIEATPVGLVAFLLVAPAGPDASESDIVALAGALGLATPEAPLPDIAPRISMDGASASLHIPEIGRALRLEAPDEWATFVRRGGAVVLLLGVGVATSSGT
jgi:hypothetical protein